MDTLLRFVRMLMILSVAITGWQLLSDRGGGQWFFTLLGLVVALNFAPYLTSLAAMKRLPLRWGLATGIAACAFGAVDVLWRMQAFNFPTENSGGEMALWLPIYAIAAIPGLALLSYPLTVAMTRRPAVSEGESPQP